MIVKFNGDNAVIWIDTDCIKASGMDSDGNARVCIGEMWEAWSEGAFYDLRMAGECWDALSAPAKEKLLSKWRDWKGLS